MRVKKRKKRYYVPLIVAILLITAATGYMYLRGPVYHEEAGDAVLAQPSDIRIPAQRTISIQANTAQTAIELYNPAENTVYLAIAIRYQGTVVLQTQLLAPGERVMYATLRRTFAPGRYDGQILYSAYNLYDQNLESELGFSITLVAE